jgi:putative Mg2+ transporter-C (MgtC) family protein
MPLALDHRQILLRLLLAAATGLLLGLNRNEAGRSAGMRTTILVSLAACIAMLQCDLLLPTAGKTSAMFSVLDLMRLPLGILTGMLPSPGASEFRARAPGAFDRDYHRAGAVAEC